MNKTAKRKGVLWLGCALAVSLAAPAGAATAAGAVARPVRGQAVPAAAQAGKQHRIKVLTAVLQKMEKNYRKYRQDTPGPQDILDYQIGGLWKQGIDGYGTSIAVIEGWDYPGIRKVVAGFDQKYGLPNPQISTVFPSGPLPPKCPPGMVKLGSYGSCSAWKGELALDVISVHLIAPYAKIVISATPADSEITDDAASQVAPPEMMRALEYISSNHLANAISISDGTGEITYSHGQEEITAQDAGELSAAAAASRSWSPPATAVWYRTSRWPTASARTCPLPRTRRPGTTRRG